MTSNLKLMITHENKYKTHKHKKLVFQNKTENADLNKPVLKK